MSSLTKEYLVTSMMGAQILRNPWVWYSLYILLIIKMSNLTITKCGTQTIDLGAMVGRCSPDSQHGETFRHSANVGCSCFRYTNNDPSNHTNQRHQHKTWARGDGKHALHCYFRSNPTQREHRKNYRDLGRKR